MDSYHNVIISLTIVNQRGKDGLGMKELEILLSKV